MQPESILPASDKRSPFYINVPPHDSRPITTLISYFKLWKHFVASLIVYLKDLLMAKEFESNLNLQLIGSIQFPGFKDLPYKCLSTVEQQLPSPSNSQTPTPNNEANNASHPPGQKESKRPSLPKTKSSSSFLKNQTFAHRKTGSLTSLSTEAAAPSQPSAHKGPGKALGALGGKTNTSQNLSAPISAAKFAPKNDVVINPTYFSPESLFSNMGSALVNEHFNTYSAQMKLCREITQKLIPRLESLHRNIGVKIKEIKTSLKDEAFANVTLIKEVSKTGNHITNFINSVSRYSDVHPVIRQNDTEDEDEAMAFTDPFLVKLSLDYQLKNQLIHENYIFASYVNLQNISKDLFNYVVKDLNSVTEKLIKVLGAESVYASSMTNCLFNLSVTLKSKLKSPEHDWEFFMIHNPNFLNIYRDEGKFKKKDIRGFKDIVVPYAESVHSKCLRCGFMFKKQKVLKSYVSYFYLLTCNFLHEFKIENSADKPSKSDAVSTTSSRKKGKGKIGGIVDHDTAPVKSYNLNDYSISVRNDKEFKFTLTKTSNSSQKFTFKCKSQAEYMEWSTDLHDLLKFTNHHTKRFKFIESKMAGRELDSPGPKVAKNSNGAVAPPSPSGGLNLGKILPGDASLNKIQPPSLNGMFTPKVQSPSHNGNPFEDRFGQSLPLAGTENVSSPASEIESPAISPHAGEPGPETAFSHQREHEHYLSLQNEIMRQQQQLLQLNIEGEGRPSLSRQSSSESVSSVPEPSNHNLTSFLNRNQGLTDHFGEGGPRNDSVSSVPSVYVSHHEDN